ncbi:14267_t:CDS:2, partial [Entrophospora sp. SA101]
MSSQKREAKPYSKNLPSLKRCKCGSLKHQHITTLEDALTHINTITFEGAKLLELYLLDKLDREVPDQIPIMDYNFIRKLFQAVSCREGSHDPQRTS